MNLSETSLSNLCDLRKQLTKAAEQLLLPCAPFSFPTTASKVWYFSTEMFTNRRLTYLFITKFASALCARPQVFWMI